jgi:hypothetical protein
LLSKVFCSPEAAEGDGTTADHATSALQYAVSIDVCRALLNHGAEPLRLFAAYRASLPDPLVLRNLFVLQPAIRDLVTMEDLLWRVTSFSSSSFFLLKRRAL